MHKLLPRAGEIAAILVARGETVAVSESSAGGLISAALLAVPGASAYYLGGAVVYTRRALDVLLDVPRDRRHGIRSASEPYVAMIADHVRAKFGATWAIAESGAAGPSGNPYGDAAGHACFAIAGPRAVVETLETGDHDRVANMEAFAAKALDLFHAVLGP